MTGSPAYTATNFNTVVDSPTYKGQIDANFAVLQTLGAWFAPQPNSPAAMNVQVNAGALFVNGAVVANALQTTGTITAPTGSNKRIDLVVIDAVTGVISVVTGSPTTGTPAAPAIPTGKLPCAQIGTVASPLLSSTTTIGTSLVNDQRTGPGAGGALPCAIVQDRKSSGTAGAALTSGSYVDRDLNTIILNTIPSGVSVSTPNLTLPAGTYDIRADLVAYRGGVVSQSNVRSVLFDTTNGVVKQDINSNDIVSMNLSLQAATMSGQHTLEARFTLSGSTQLKFRTWTDSSTITAGNPSNFSGNSEPEVYLNAKFTKVS